MDSVLQGDPDVEALCRGVKMPTFGLVWAALHPAPAELRTGYDDFLRRYTAAWEARGIVPEKQFYAYPAHSLHCTVATFHPYRERNPPNRKATACAWWSAVQGAATDKEWPKSGRVRVVGARLERSAGYLQLEDVDGCIRCLRMCMRRIIAGGEHDEEIRTSGSSTSFMRIPQIFHMTVVRWRPLEDLDRVPFEDLRRAFCEAWPAGQILEIPISTLSLLQEDFPCMAKSTILNSIAL